MDSRLLPLCVDLDGTLTPVDTFLEACVELLKQNPLKAALLPFWLMKGVAYAKQKVVESIEWDPKTVPLNEAFLEFLRKERASGRKIYLATAAPERVARDMASLAGFFEGVISTTFERNLIGRRKAEELVNRFGAGGFEYAGNSRADMPVWMAAGSALVVYPSPGVIRSLKREQITVINVFSRSGSQLKHLITAMRPYQLVKNLLIFVPLLSSHEFTDPALVGKFVLAYIAFSCLTSAVYLFNDLFDMPHDRAHAEKKFRPIAWGLVGIPLIVSAILILIAAGLLISSLFPPLFSLTLAVYLVFATLYSLVFKKIPVADTVLLAFLYTLRIIAGNTASGISFSFWLLMFSVFFFFGLAELKRYAELNLLSTGSGLSPEGGGGQLKIPGRGYTTSDIPMIQSLGTASAMVSILILGLYVDSQRVTLLYQRPYILWFECLLVLYWLSRMWFLAGRKKITGDPIIFTFKDRTSYIIGFLVAVVAVLAT